MDPLKEKLKTLPSAPGVYFHKNAAGEIIYVGKAAVLKNRVRQYFQKSDKDPKTEALVREIAMVDWTVVDTEMDALFLESEMIKRYKPKWNILLRDDKNVSYVRINFRDKVPTVTVTRQPLGDDATYIGPFYAKGPLVKSLRILRKIFPYYDKPYDGKKTLNTDLRLTPGLEIGASDTRRYKLNLRKLERYLTGQRDQLLRDLKKDMAKAAREQRYEEAAEIRNQLAALGELRKKIVFSDKEFMDISSDQALKQLQRMLGLKEPPRRIEGYDISHQSGENAVGSMVVFTNGAADRAEYRKFKIKISKNNDTENLREVVSRRLKHTEWTYPDVMIVDGGGPQLRALQPLADEAGIPLIGRDKSGDHSHAAPVVLAKLEDGAVRYATLPKTGHLARLIARIDEEAHRFAITYHTLLKRKNLLK